MNHLAHVVLAGPAEGARLGAFLGDHVKGTHALERLSAPVAGGVRLHRFIDSRCDNHPALRAFVRQLDPPWRRYGPIVLDVLFDTMLTRHWARFGPSDLARTGQEIDRLLIRHARILPERLRRFAAWARHYRLWTRYADRAMLEMVFAGLARRHARPSPLARGLELLDRHETGIEALFLEVFPDLLGAVEAHPDRRRAGPVYSSISSM